MNFIPDFKAISVNLTLCVLFTEVSRIYLATLTCLHRIHSVWKMFTFKQEIHLCSMFFIMNSKEKSEVYSNAFKMAEKKVKDFMVNFKSTNSA